MKCKPSYDARARAPHLPDVMKNAPHRMSSCSDSRLVGTAAHATRASGFRPLPCTLGVGVGTVLRLSAQRIVDPHRPDASTEARPQNSNVNVMQERCQLALSACPVCSW